jgi:hypothetical protein
MVYIIVSLAYDTILQPWSVYLQYVWHITQYYIHCMYASMLVLQHKMLRFDNVGMSILMMFSNVQLYFRVMRNIPISFVSRKAFVNLPRLSIHMWSNMKFISWQEKSNRFKIMFQYHVQSIDKKTMDHNYFKSSAKLMQASPIKLTKHRLCRCTLAQYYVQYNLLTQ